MTLAQKLVAAALVVAALVLITLAEANHSTGLAVLGGCLMGSAATATTLTYAQRR